jgi:hypothetical protein
VTRPLLLVLALLTIAGVVVLRLGSGSQAARSLQRGVGTTRPKGKPGTAPAAAEQDSRREVAPAVEADGAPAPETPEGLDLGEDHLDIVVGHVDGTPARYVVVDVRPAGQGPKDVTQLTSADGNFRIEGLSAGMWNIKVSQPPGFLGPSEDLERAHAVPHPGPPPEFVLYPAGSVEGIVLDDGGAPIGAKLFLFREDFLQQSPGTESDEETGAFQLTPLPAGLLRLRAQGATGPSELVEVQVEWGRVTPDVVLRLPPGGEIEVTVLGGQGDPLPRVDVVLLAEMVVAEAERTNDRGRASFGPVQPGTWSVVAVINSQDKSSLISARAEVAAGATTSIELRPPTDGVTVSGRVTRTGAPVGGLDLLFFREDFGFAEGLSMTRSAVNGRFELLLGAPGPYQVMFQGDGLVPLRRIDVPDQGTFKLDLTLPGGSVSGRLTNPGEVGRRLMILLEREDGYLARLFPNDHSPESANTSGDFTFADVRPGTYRLRVITEGESYAEMLTGIEVGLDEQVRGLELSLRPAASLLVELSRSDGAPPAGASVVARTLAGAPLMRRPKSAGWRSTLLGLPTGRVLISAQAGDLVATREVLLEAGARGRVSLVLKPGGFLDVTCERSGEPVGAALRLFGPDGDEVSDLMTADTHRATYFSVVSSSKRRFGPLPPGQYEATATGADGSTSRRGVRIDAGQTRALVLEL